MKVVVFLGPTLPLADARQILPDAIYLPPARHSDLLSAVTMHEPDVIVLIDGVFRQSIAIWHKEILYALHRGIWVYGASSMGALRAVECAEFGMVGVGEVVRMYESGEITDDGEVALVHATPELGYRALTLPMVNVRATLGDAFRAGRLDNATFEQLVDIAASIFFEERSVGAILRKAAEKGFSHEQVESARAILTAGYRDIKKEDALLALNTVKHLPEPLPRFVERVPMEKSFLFQTQYNRDRRVEHEGVEMPLAAVANYVALHDPEYNDLSFAAMNRALVRVLADVYEVQAAPEDIDEEVKRFRLRRRLGEDADFDRWLVRNHIRIDEFRDLMEQYARARRLHKWMLTALHFERNAKLVLDELRLRDRYEAWAEKASEQERILNAFDEALHSSADDEVPDRDLVTEHLQETEGRMDTVFWDWAEDSGFHSRLDLRNELLRAKFARSKLKAYRDSALAASGTSDQND